MASLHAPKPPQRVFAQTTCGASAVSQRQRCPPAARWPVLQDSRGREGVRGHSPLGSGRLPCMEYTSPSPAPHPTRHLCNRNSGRAEPKSGCVSYVQVGFAPVSHGAPFQETPQREIRKDPHKDYRDYTCSPWSARACTHNTNGPPKNTPGTTGHARGRPQKKKKRRAP